MTSAFFNPGYSPLSRLAMDDGGDFITLKRSDLANAIAHTLAAGLLGGFANAYADYGIVYDDAAAAAANSVKIQQALDDLAISDVKTLFIPAIGGDVYYDTTLNFTGNDVRIVGASTGTRLRYTGTGTGLGADTTTVSYARCGIDSVYLYSTTGAKAFDFTQLSYGTFRNFEINYTATNAVAIWAKGDGLGYGPYFNVFSEYIIIGGADRTQIGIQLVRGSSGSLADGPNSNQFYGCKRIASIGYGLDLQSGTGNFFYGLSCESVKYSGVRLNYASSYTDTGVVTSFTNNTITDSTKTWSLVNGDEDYHGNSYVLITNGAYAGTCRRVMSNTVDTLTLDKVLPGNIGTPNYALIKSKCIRNYIIGFRQEGLASDNPTGIEIKPGARANEITNVEIGSVTNVVVDTCGDTSNRVKIGELRVQRFIVENPGASASIELIPRLSVYGGIREGSSMAIEWIDLSSPNFVAGSAAATLTVDHGGASTGTGSNTVTCVVEDETPKSAFRPSADRSTRSTQNYGIFAKLTTNANVNAAADFIVTICYRVE